MKKLALAVFLCALPSCQCPSTMVDATKLEPVVAKVLDRHDAYVAADQTLDELSKRTFLRSSELTRSILAEALGTATRPSR